MFSKHTVGLVTNNFESLYHTPMLQMLHARLCERGYRLLGIMGTPGEIASNRVASDRVDGWLVINTTTGVEALSSTGKPLVLVGGVSGDLPCVVPDNYAGTAAAVAHLIAQGRTRIAFVTYPVNPDFRERYAAYAAALADHAITLDPTLVLDTQSYQVPDAYQAVRRLIAEGRRFDAAFCANDWLAFGTMQAVQEAGWRIPEDVAVIGFDDTAEAQFATPPLTSVRQNPAELGRVAIELLLDQIEHRVTPPRCTVVPTALVVRDSSGMAQHSASELPRAECYCGDDWRTRLARALAQQTILPVPLAPDTPPEQVWPGVDTLVGALADAVDGGREPPEVPYHVWEAAQRLAGGGQALTQIVELLRKAGVQHIQKADDEALERLTRWLLACQRQITHHQVVANNNQAERDRQLFLSETMLLSQVGGAGASPRLISWMDQSHAEWAALGLWRDGGGDRVLDISSIYKRETGASPTQLQVAPERFPPLEQLSAPVRDSLEYLIKITPLASGGRQWGYLAYAERFVWTFNDTITNRNTYIAAALEREELLDSLHERQETLQAAYERERNLADTIRELGCPIIPLLPGVLLVPLVGAIDAARSSQIIERVLAEVSRTQAERVLLDITGVPLVDTDVAGALVQMARAVALLGAKVTLVGVRPEIAQSIVGLGADLGMFETRPVLSAALAGLIGRAQMPRRS
jgi:DNA-binding LacI/PurR family transcriptional regulator/anti-anti-sigma regulatory factor